MKLSTETEALCAKLREARRNAPPNSLCHRIGPPLTEAEIGFDGNFLDRLRDLKARRGDPATVSRDMDALMARLEAQRCRRLPEVR
jgi:hypothetical protein